MAVTGQPAAADTSTDKDQRPLRQYDRWALAIVLLAIAVRIVVLRATHCTIEDALISLRYAENLAAGRGFVFNPGEHVLGTTTPLFTLILAAGAATPLGGLAVGKAIAILADGLACY